MHVKRYWNGARALKMYVRDLDQKDWDEYAERLTFAINSAHDRIRGGTPHYLIDAGGYTASRMYQMARSRHATVTLSSPTALSTAPGANQCQIEGSYCRSDQPTDRGWISHRVKEGYARKLAHLWHGPFRVAEKVNEFSIKLEIAGTEYQIFPVVHVPQLKLVKDFPDRTSRWTNRIASTSMRSCFRRTARSPISEPTIKRISDVRSGKKTRFGRIYREFLVHWDMTTDLGRRSRPHQRSNTDAFLRERASRNRFNTTTNTVPSAAAKQVRAIQIQADDSGSDSGSDESGGSDSHIDSHRRIFLATNEDVTPKVEKRLRISSHDFRTAIIAIKITTGSPTVMASAAHRCSLVNPAITWIVVAGGVLRAQSAAKEDIRRSTASSCVADVENSMTWKNPIEVFYHQIRQWFNPTKHMNMLHEAAEKILN
ncbi:LOW QUALITY PROTEIN: hypothetical protein PHMEG_0006663 [Phytophthora megakarya]|uniref:Reverse transcriptase n=1 Tax=Phytophthora megakarya TaxID=4795 RepID=A0A225WNE1_9STRA|nr:LOW QUALITY PROTEIN: hypothetical protein PHMEG_0006663 [Phytophthora megakarya]